MSSMLPMNFKKAVITNPEPNIEEIDETGTDINNDFDNELKDITKEEILLKEPSSKIINDNQSKYIFSFEDNAINYAVEKADKWLKEDNEIYNDMIKMGGVSESIVTRCKNIRYFHKLLKFKEEFINNNYEDDSRSNTTINDNKEIKNQIVEEKKKEYKKPSFKVENPINKPKVLNESYKEEINNACKIFVEKKILTKGIYDRLEEYLRSDEKDWKFTLPIVINKEEDQIIKGKAFLASHYMKNKDPVIIVMSNLIKEKFSIDNKVFIKIINTDTYNHSIIFNLNKNYQYRDQI